MNAAMTIEAFELRNGEEKNFLKLSICLRESTGAQRDEAIDFLLTRASRSVNFPSCTMVFPTSTGRGES